MKRIAMIVAVVFALFLSAGPNIAQNANTKNDKQPANASVRAEPKELPWYFPAGVIHTTDWIKQRQEYFRYLQAQKACYQSNDDETKLIPGSDSIRITYDGKNGAEKIPSTASMSEKPEFLTLVFDHHVRTDEDTIVRMAKRDGIFKAEAQKNYMYRVTTLCEQRLISEHEFQIEKEDLFEQTKIAAARDFEFYGPLPDIAIAARAKELGVPEAEFRKQLDEKVPGHDVTYRELNYLPRSERLSNFVPRELHLAVSPGIPMILGATWLNTGIIYYNQQARVRDYLVGHPGVLQHEMVHVNSNLQSFPANRGIDEELIASIPEMLYPEDKIDLPRHPYAEDLRDWIHVYFGFDWEEAEKESFSFDLGGQIVINEAKYKENYEKLEKVKEALLPLFQKKVFPSLYSKYLWWAAMNSRRGDNNTVFRILMSQNFCISILGGCRETTLYLKAHEEETKEWAKKAWESTKDSNNSDNSTGGMRAPQFALDEYMRIFSKSEHAEFEKRCRENEKACRELLANPQKLIEYLTKFKADVERAKGGAR